MNDSALPLPIQLLDTFDSVVLQMLETVDVATSRNGDSIVDKVQKQLVRQIKQLSLRHGHRRNSQQAIFKLPPELLIRSMSPLSTNNLLSVIRVCRRLRTITCEASSLWTRVDRINDPSALRLVLECAKGLPVSITSLRVNGTNDDLLRVVASHMSHIRALSLHIDASFGEIGEGTHAYVFTTPAPILQQLSFIGVDVTENAALPLIGLHTPSTGHSTPLFAGIAPLLNSMQIRRVDLDGLLLLSLPNRPALRVFSIGKANRFVFSESKIRNGVSELLPHLATLNLELAGWELMTSTGSFPPSLRRINIRWTGLASLSPVDTIPKNLAWNLVHIIHVTHTYEPPRSQASNVGSLAIIPATNLPYQALYTRFSATNGPHVHTRAVDVDNRERIFCGLQPATVAGMVSRIPPERLSAITTSTATIAFNVLSNARCPALRCIHLVSDTCDASWIDVFARDVFVLATVERVEFSVEANEKAYNWTTTTILRALASCMAAGSILNEVVFLGFEPEARCVSRAATFADRVIVDSHWQEPSADRIWFTQPSFDWT